MRKPAVSQQLDVVPPSDLQGEPSCLRRAQEALRHLTESLARFIYFSFLRVSDPSLI